MAGAVLGLAGTVGAIDRTWTTDADFAAGSLTDVVVAGDAISLALDGVGTPDPSIPWWDTDWGQRRCIEITNPGTTALSEYQVAFTIDTATPIAGGRMVATGEDIRLIASDAATELDHWVEGPIDDAATRVWVQVDTLPVGASTICLYHDNPAASSTSDPLAPFTHTTPAARYVAVSETHAGQPIAVVSYVDGNVVSDGTTSVTLDEGDTHTFPGGAIHTPATVVTANGPIAVQGTGNNGDTYVPVAFAGTTFVIPTQRNTNRVSVYAPFADATVSVAHSGSTTSLSVPAGTSVSSAVDLTGSGAGVLTSDQPVLVTHQASGAFDAAVLVPATTEPLYGIRSTQHITGFVAAGSATVTESDGSATSIAAGASSTSNRTGGGSRGSGNATLTTVTSGGPIGAFQQADADGVESTSHWPASELNVQYRMPVLMDYAAIACTVQAAGSLDVDGNVTDCTGAGGAGFPGKALTGALAAGDLVSSTTGSTFHLYAEDDAHDDENNVLGPKQARQRAAQPPTAVVGSEESRYVASGDWTSDAHDAGCAADFGQLSWSPASQPAGADVRFQVGSAEAAAGPFTFLGPDGTGATFFTVAAGTDLAPVHDGDRFVQVRGELTSTSGVVTPVVDDVSVEATGRVTISAAVFGDVDADGVDGGADTDLGGVDVTLWRDDGDASFDPALDTAVETTSTASDGTAQFAPGPPGTYFVEADPDTIPVGHRTTPSTPNPAGPFVLAECGDAIGSIGFVPEQAVEVTVFSDVDADGVSAGDPLLDGVSVELWRDDGDGVFDDGLDVRAATAATVGGVAGFDVTPGTYFAWVRPDDAPSGHLSDATTANPTAAIVAVPSPASAVVTAEIGFQPVATLVGAAFVDADGDGGFGPGERPLVRLSIGVYEDDGDGAFDPATDTLVMTVFTGPDGAYTAAGLDPGSHWLVPADPAPEAAPIEPVLVETPSGRTARDLPFAPVTSITGVAVFDEDGVVDATSTPVTGLAIALIEDDGDGRYDPDLDRRVAVVTTGADGSFSFDQLSPGEYFVDPLGRTLLESLGVRLVGTAPFGPFAAGTADVVIAFDRSTVTLPATGGGAGSHRTVLASSVFVLVGLALVGSTRRRRDGDRLVG
ncbi:MAG: DUF2341 domain-containing protein [Actinomycetota bacterium]